MALASASRRFGAGDRWHAAPPLSSHEQDPSPKTVAFALITDLMPCKP